MKNSINQKIANYNHISKLIIVLILLLIFQLTIHSVAWIYSIIAILNRFSDNDPNNNYIPLLLLFFGSENLFFITFNLTFEILILLFGIIIFAKKKLATLFHQNNFFILFILSILIIMPIINFVVALLLLVSSIWTYKNIQSAKLLLQKPWSNELA